MLLLQGTKEEDKEINAKNKLAKIYDNIDTFTLNRKWTKLSLLQKQDRIKNFVETSIEDEKIRAGVEKKLLTLLESGDLKQKCVDYDSKTGTIKAVNLEEKQTKEKTKKEKVVKEDKPTKKKTMPKLLNLSSDSDE